MGLTRSISIPVGAEFGIVAGRSVTTAGETVALCSIGLGASERAARLEGTVYCGGDVIGVTGITMVNPDDGVLHLAADDDAGPVSLSLNGNAVELRVAGDPDNPAEWTGVLSVNVIYDYAFC